MSLTRPLHRATLSLGSNLGDRYENLIEGIAYLLAHGLSLLDCSGIYETVPVGYTDQPDFFNMVVCMATALEPLDLLEACQGAERSRLRERVIHWGPRTLDVDILLYDDVAMDTPILTLPHPRMAERAFVMGPMAEMDPDLAVNLALPDGSIDFTGILHKIPAIDVKIRIANR